MGNYLFHSPAPLEERLRIAIFNKDRNQVDEVLNDPHFSKAALGVNVYVEAVQKLWDWGTISKLCDGATLENAVTTLTTSVICGATVEFKVLFECIKAAAARQGKNLEEVIEAYALRNLFIVVCHKNNDEMLEAFLQNGCFIKTDARPLRYFVHRELRKNSTASPKQIRRLLQTHEGQAAVVEQLLQQYENVPASKARLEASRTIILGTLKEFLSDTISKSDEPNVFGAPSYQRTVKTVAHAMVRTEDAPEEAIKAVTSFIAKT